jgi:hypothetical protein
VTDKAAKEQDGISGISAMAEVAATVMRGAFMVPLEAMKAATRLQEKAIDLMESFVPGVDPDVKETSEGVRQPPPAGASASAASASATTAATGGWGPVTQQDPATGWGPMPRKG